MSSDFLETVEQRLDIEAARRAPPSGFPALPPVPAGRYTREDFAALERERVWRASWVFVARDGDVDAAPGSYLSIDTTGSPLLLVRGRDGLLRAFYNACRHRGAPVVRDICGRANVLRCQFHSWCYDLDGRLVSVPDAHDFIDLDATARGLLPVRCESWAGLVFVNENGNAPPLHDWLDSIPADLACMDAASLRTVHRARYRIECNWKAAMEAFLEIYHLETLHPGARGMIDCPANAIELMPHGHSRQAMRKRMLPGQNWNTMPGAPDIPAMPDIYRRNTITYSLFPNIVVPAEAFGLPMLVFHPRGTRQCEMEFLLMGPDWGDAPRPDYWDTFLSPYTRVLEEDQHNLAPIQRSLEIGAFADVLFNYQERRLYWVHEEIDRLIGGARVPPELAVAPVLAAFQLEPWEHMRTRMQSGAPTPA